MLQRCTRMLRAYSMMRDCSGVYGRQSSPGNPEMCMYVGTSGPSGTICALGCAIPEMAQSQELEVTVVEAGAGASAKMQVVVCWWRLVRCKY